MTGASPTTSNSAAEIMEQIVSAIMSGGVAAAEAYVLALDPAVLSIPIIAWAVDEGISYIAQFISIAGQKFVDGVVINIQTDLEDSNVVNAATELALAQGSGDQAAIAKAVADASAAYKAAINFDGWATPS